jgi:hypothetical protein
MGNPKPVTPIHYIRRGHSYYIVSPDGREAGPLPAGSMQRVRAERACGEGKIIRPKEDDKKLKQAGD